MFHALRSKLKAQSLLEALLSITLGVILIGGSVGLIGVSLKTFNTAKQHLQANSLMRQTAEIIQSLARDNWHNISDLTPGIHYKLAKQGNAYAFQKGEEKIFDSQNLVSYWSFDEATSTIAYDNQSTNNGTLTNGPTWQSSSNCISGTCLSFDGENDYVGIGTGNNYFPLPTFSICSWVKTPGLASGMSLNGIISLTYGLIMDIDSNGQFITRMDDGTNVVNVTASSNNLYDNKFHHLCLTFDGFNRNMFIDGVIAKSSVTTWLGTTRWPTNSCNIGFDNNNPPTYRFNGLVDEPRIYSRALTADEIKTHYNAGLDKLGLVSYWALDENATTTAYDSQSTNNGTLTNGPTWQAESNCVSGSCLSFNGSSSYVLVPKYGNEFFSTGPFTIEAWVKVNDLSTIRPIVCTGNPNSEPAVNFWIQSSKIRFILRESGGSGWIDLYSVSTLSTGAWYHVAVVRDGSNMRIFLNGNSDNSKSTGPTGNVGSTTYQLHLGKMSYAAYYFNGLIDEPRIYNRVLSAEEISQRYQASYTKYFVTNKISRTSGAIDTTYNSSNDDPSTLKINSVVKYGRGLVSQQTGGIADVRFYLTRSYNNQTARQNDWSEGSSVLGPSANFGNTYYSSSGILDDYANKLVNNGFDSIESGYSPGWDVSLNGTYRPASSTPWSTGYNSGVASSTIGYHAHINSTCGTGNSPCFEYIDENCQYGYCHRWLGINYPLGTPSSLGWSAGRKITVKLYGKVNNVLKPVSFGLYYYNTGGTVTFHSGRPDLYFSLANTWELQEYTFTLINDIDITKSISLYIYGHFGSVEGRLWVDNVILQNGPQLVLASGSSSGELTSSILDTGVSGGPGFNSLLWQGSLGTGGAVKFQIAFSNSASGPWTDYYGPTSTSDYYQPNPNVSIAFPTTGSASPQNYRYLRYKVYLSTTGTSPQVNDTIINWSP